MRYKLKKKRRRVMTKFICMAITLITIFSLTMTCLADDKANDMARSMLTFFREDRTGLDTDSLSEDEVRVYGVFLSNFFVPGQTVINDLKGDTALSKKVSAQFFGTEDKTKELGAVNSKLHEAITGVLSSNAKKFGLYTSADNATAGKVMTGKDLLSKIVSGNGELYNNNGKVVMDLDEKAVRGVMQVLFGYSTDMFMSSTGIPSLTGMYIDGLGNIWGSYNSNGAQVEVGEYVLILPACLNPTTFATTSTGQKFPMTNAFVMGGILKVGQDFLASADLTTSYYNIKSYFTTGSSPSAKMNNENLVTIYGVASPRAFIGNSDNIIKNGLGSNCFNDVKKFINESANDSVVKANATVLIAVDGTKIPDVSNISKLTGFSTEQCRDLFSYLTDGNRFTLNEIYDDMFYFSGVNGANGSDGSWKDDGSLTLSRHLFTKEDNGATLFYDSSYSASPFSRFLLDYTSADSANKAKLLQGKLVSAPSTSSSEYKALTSFLDNGSFNTTSGSVVADAMELISKDKLVYNTVPISNRVSESALKNWKIFIKIKGNKTPAVWGLTSQDSAIFNASSNANHWLVADAVLSNHPFSKDTDSIGSLAKTINDKDMNAITMYIHNALTYKIFSVDNKYSQALTGSMYAGTKVKGKLGELKVSTAVMNEVNNWAGIYWGYMTTLLGIYKDADGKWQTKPYSNTLLPEMVISVSGGAFDMENALESGGVDSSDDVSLEKKQKDIINKVYSLLTDDFNSFRAKLIKFSISDFVLDTHRSLTGSWVGEVLSVSSGGNNTYGSIVGFINTPTLYDLPLTSWILSEYMYVYISMLAIVLIILLMMVIVNSKGVREAFLIFILMAGVLLLPQFFIDNSIRLSNKVGDHVYSDKFMYWAVLQHQQSLNGGLSSGGSADDVIVANAMQQAKEAYSKDAGVRIKWMSPKKNDVFDSIFSSVSKSSGLSNNLTLFRWLFNSVLNQEEYVYNDPLATYLYRPYTAIANEAKNSNSSLKGNDTSRELARTNVLGGLKSKLGVQDYEFNTLVNNGTNKVVMTDQQKKLIKSASPFVTDSSKEAMYSDYRYWLMCNSEVTNSIFRSTYEANTNAGYVVKNEDEYSNAFLLATESPYYYFYNALNNRYSSVNGGFKSALLTEDVFKVDSSNKDINGKTRDFLDLEGLFTYQIPYLNQANEYVYGWTETYGKDIDGYNYADGIGSVRDAESKAEFTEAKNRKEQMKQVWKLYCPWVDQLYSLDNMHNQKVSVAKTKVYVDNTLNPDSYEAVGRPMIFSEADMYAKNYRYSDLTDVERRIQAVLDKTYEDMMYLVNYYDFDNEVLVSMASMMATFNFNNEFSQSRIIGESSTLYPQGFELKNFNYDAFLRLALMNATGESLMDSEDLYNRVLSKTSIFTGIVLLALDFIGVVIIPAVKIIIILLLLILSLVLCISSVLNPPEKIMKTVFSYVIAPTLLFLATNIGFTLVMGIFIGNGLTDYVGTSSPTVSLSDPTITLCIMCVIGVVYCFILFKILNIVFKSFKKYALTSVLGAVGLATGVAHLVGSKIKNMTRNGVNMSRDIMEHRRHKELTTSLNSLGDKDIKKDVHNEDKAHEKHDSNDKSNNSYKDEDDVRDEALKEELNDKTDSFKETQDKNLKWVDKAKVDAEYKVKDTVTGVTTGVKEKAKNVKDTVTVKSKILKDTVVDSHKRNMDFEGQENETKEKVQKRKEAHKNYKEQRDKEYKTKYNITDD